MTLRAADESDFDIVAEIWHESASLPGVGPPVMPTLTELRTRVDRELVAGWEVTVATSGEAIVGFAALKPQLAVLDQLFVKPSFHGGGVGKALLEHAMVKMTNGFTLHTASANHRARRFYEAAGLTLVRDGSHPNTGHPVTFYEWRVGQGLSAGALG
jgi:ribosomal protein S18 acetylase RimI-like enzyme